MNMMSFLAGCVITSFHIINLSYIYSTIGKCKNSTECLIFR